MREAIRADSATRPYADMVAISVHDGVVTLSGHVDDLDDSDNQVAAAAYVEGVVEAVDRLQVRALEERD